ncbi:MAG: dockerin type I domain-containing protein, partial [Acidobacteriota bacterium]|nr:dockerin type I domain-containing protein [Acidobacteriota bacterium]
ALVIEGVHLENAQGSMPMELGGGVFLVLDDENSRSPIVPFGKVLLSAGKSLTIPLAGGRTATVKSTATAPLPAVYFDPPFSTAELSFVSSPQTITGFMHASGDLDFPGDLLLDGGRLYVDGNLRIRGAVKGNGYLAAKGQITFEGPVEFLSDEVAIASMTGVTFKTPAAAPSIPGDVNGDGVVNCLDLLIVKQAFGARIGNPSYNPAADVNHDGVVDIRDLAFVSRQLPPGTKCP